MKLHKTPQLRWIVSICIPLIISIQAYGQSISPYLYGHNAWMPSITYNGHFENVIDNLNSAGNKPFKIIRIGGTTYDDNPPTWSQYEALINKIRSIGAEPLVQVSIASSSTYAANFVNWLNNTRGLNVKYFSIGNEPDLGWLNETVDGETIDWGYKVAAYFKARASAMKAVDPSIKIFGPDFSFFVDNVDDSGWDPMATWHYPLLNNNNHGLWGTDANGRYYIDYYAFHVYQYVTPSNVERKLQTVMSKINSINANYRNGSNPLGWAITETHIGTNNDNASSHDKAWSFYAGQHIAQIFGLGMKYKAFTVAPWSIHESSGARTAFDLGFFDAAPAYKPRSTYYHQMMLAHKAKKNYAWGYTNNGKVKQVSTRDETGYAVMVLNDNAFGGNYTIRLNYDSQVNTFVVYVDAGVANQYQSYIGANETQMVFFNSSGDYIGKITYNKGHADSQLSPQYSGSTPNRSGRVAEINDEVLVQNEEILIYPNPVVDGKIVLFKPKDEEVRIFNAAGKLLMETHDSEIDVSHLSSGVYLLKGNSWVRRFTIE